MTKETFQLKVTDIYNARRIVKPDEDFERHYEDLKAMLIEEKQVKGFKYEKRNLIESDNVELIVVGYCGEFVDQ